LPSSESTSAIQQARGAMSHIFRVALLAFFCLLGCGSVAITKPHFVFVGEAMLPLLLSLSPAAVFADADVEEDASNAEDANAGVADDAEVSEKMIGEALPETMMKEMDRDKDGFLSLVELMLEADAEVEESEKKLLEKAFSTADVDQDGKLSAAELPTAIKEYETLSEAEGDGSRSLAEADGREDINNADDTNAGTLDDAKGGDITDEEATPEAIMEEMDKDKDGFLSLVEIMPDADAEEEQDKKLMEKAFSTADADKDGRLSAAELPVAMKEYEKVLSEAELEDIENNSKL